MSFEHRKEGLLLFFTEEHNLQQPATSCVNS